jgi:hypothetical protein
MHNRNGGPWPAVFFSKNIQNPNISELLQAKMPENAHRY